MLEISPPRLSKVAFLAAPARYFVSIGALAAGVGDDALANPLPRTPKRVTQGGISYLWSGPRSWLAMSATPGLFGEISARLGGRAALTEQSDGLFTLLVTGPHARDILAKLVPIDLDERVFPPDAVALTLAAHIGVRLWREADGAFALACLRSFAHPLHHALQQAGEEFSDDNRRE